jgi:hypothetical protein
MPVSQSQNIFFLKANMKHLMTIFKDAAIMVDSRCDPETGDHHPCCPMISAAQNYGSDNDAQGLFAEYFKKPRIDPDDLWFGECLSPRMGWPLIRATRINCPNKLHSNKNTRVMALLFMAEIAKDLKSSDAKKMRRARPLYL